MQKHCLFYLDCNPGFNVNFVGTAFLSSQREDESHTNSISRGCRVAYNNLGPILLGLFEV